jgi:hypothetical protein
MPFSRTKPAAAGPFVQNQGSPPADASAMQAELDELNAANLLTTTDVPFKMALSSGDDSDLTTALAPYGTGVVVFVRVAGT